ncbi:MAG: ribonuclease Y [Candidatus Brocadiia bacterium]
MEIYIIVALAVVAAVLLLAVLALRKKASKAAEAERAAMKELAGLRDNLESCKREIGVEAEKSAVDKLRTRIDDFDRESKEARAEIKVAEKRIESREDRLEKKETELRDREKNLLGKEKRVDDIKASLDKKESVLDEKIAAQESELLRIAELSKEEAEKKVLVRVEQELGSQVGELVQKAMEKVVAEVDEKAKDLLTTAIQRYSGDQVSDILVSTVDLPSDEMKGRIIGREGRNIRTFEKATGTDVVVDDTPGVVVVSGFDPVRREIARRSMEKLITDGRIHPGRIEEVVEKTKQETLNEIQKAGTEAFTELGLAKANPKIIMLLGRLKFRSSYGQNVLQHSKEVAHLMGMVATELGLDVTLAKRCGLLHDIGKSVDHESEGTHTEIGMEIAKRYGEAKEVVNAIGSHHEGVDPDNVYSILVKVMDSISAGRPGARSETLEKYLKRLEKLEAIAMSLPGVDHCYAIQAGRELRVIIDADKVGDKEVFKICRDIAQQIEKELTYPGEIRVTCLRETRVIEVAR